MSAKLRELVAKWRRQTHCNDEGGYVDGLSDARNKCADELEAALAEKPAERPAVSEWTAQEEEVITELMKKQELSRHAVLRQGLRLFQMLDAGEINLSKLPGDSSVPLWQRLEAKHSNMVVIRGFPNWGKSGE